MTHSGSLDPQSHHQLVRATANLMLFVTSPELSSMTLLERRQKLMDKVAELISADLGIWCWGRGVAANGEIQPVATVDYRMTEVHRTALADAGLQREIDVEFRAPIIQRMGPNRQISICKNELYTAEHWERNPSFRKLCNRLGMDRWITAVRFQGADTWCNLTFWRKECAAEFELFERELLNVVVGNIAWVLPAATEFLPPETFNELTPRQRTVLILLLEGMSRKAVAKNLGLTEHTVGDHIKSIYRTFNVHSLSELAALLLKSV